MTVSRSSAQDLHDADLLALFLPEGVLEYFDCKDVSRDSEGIHIVLEEKNSPPITSVYRGKRVQSKGFWEISVNDFPIRGRKTFLHFKRRIWKVEGEKELLKRDISLVAPGTQLEKAFALFLKAKSRRAASSTEDYC